MLFLKITRNQLPSFPIFTTFSPIKHHKNSPLSTFTIRNPHVNQNKESIPSNFPPKTSLVPSNNMTPKPTTTTLSNPQICHEIVSSNKIITSYIRSGDLHSALRVFDNMRIKTTVTWNSMLAGYSKNRGNLKDAQQLFDKIPQPDTVSYNIMLSCILLNSDDIETALDFFNRFPFKDIASWNTMISGFAQNKNMVKAQELFLAMPEKNSVSWSAMISGYVECGDLDKALQLFRAAPVKSVVAWTATISGCMKFGNVSLAETLFNEMPVKNLVTWNAMIAGYVENCRAEDGLKLFRMMVRFGIKPNASSLTSVLLGCSELSALQLGKQIHQLVFKSPLCNDSTAATSLISRRCNALTILVKDTTFSF
ncbi:hypothetical protein Q3G72_016025 [Acer saccharum]|nr:hypothetical protein Q3G72_016025 [Acer saccharum]